MESALGPALQAAYTIMQDYGGKMLVFQNAVPSLGTVALLLWRPLLCGQEMVRDMGKTHALGILKQASCSCLWWAHLRAVKTHG